MSQLRHLEEDVAIATLCPKASLLRWLLPNVAIVTQCLSVAIAMFGGIRHNSDAFFVTQCLSVAIAMFGGICHNSDALFATQCLNVAIKKFRRIRQRRSIHRRYNNTYMQ